MFLAQTWMIEKAMNAAKPVVISTQVMDTMAEQDLPTRGEASDIAQCIIDGADSVLLSGETATGAYPQLALQQLVKVCCEAENVDYEKLFHDIKEHTPSKQVKAAEAIAATSCQVALETGADIIIAMTETGKIARYIAKYRPVTPILACSTSSYVVRQMNLLRGVMGYKIPEFIRIRTEKLLRLILKVCQEQGLIETGKVVIVHGEDEDTPNESNTFKMVDLDVYAGKV